MATPWSNWSTPAGITGRTAPRSAPDTRPAGTRSSSTTPASPQYPTCPPAPYKKKKTLLAERAVVPHRAPASRLQGFPGARSRVGSLPSRQRSWQVLVSGPPGRGGNGVRGGGEYLAEPVVGVLVEQDAGAAFAVLPGPL